MAKTKDKEVNTEEVVRETMTGDLRDIILSILRTQAKTWKELTEDEQRNLSGDVQARCEYIVSKAVKIIAADGRAVIEGELEQVTVKDGLKAVIRMSKTHELRHAVVDATGLAVLVVVSDSAEYQGERAAANIDKDQPRLPVDDDKPVADSGRATGIEGKIARAERAIAKNGKKDAA